jgi:uncharacterized SAM-binding protein YcdF (DUF218 family)
MYRLFVDLFQPHTLLLIWACWALVIQWLRRGDSRRRWWPLFVPLICLAVLSTPAAAYLALLPLECYADPLDERPVDAEAIVVFTSGVFPPEGRRSRAEMDEDGVKRCLLAARQYRQGPPCLVLVSGGKVDSDAPGPSFAAVLGECLELLGVKAQDLVLEENSRTTYENAVECGRILKDRHIKRVMLVVDAVDMYRAASCLRGQHIEVIPSPSHIRAASFPFAVTTFVPGPGGAQGVQRAWHEWLGIAWYWSHGRL